MQTARQLLYIVDGLGLSGKTKALVDLACHVDPRRFRPHVCCLGREDSPLVDRLAARDIPVTALSCRDGLDFRAVRSLSRLIREIRPAIVHCYNPRPMLYGGLAAKCARVRGTVGSLSAFACLCPDQDYHFLPQGLFTTSRKNRQRNRLACRFMRYVVAVAPSLGQQFFGFNGLPPDKLRTIAYGVDVTATQKIQRHAIQHMRCTLGATRGELLVGSLGRLVEQKDYTTQLKGFARALHDAPGMRMALAGDGPLRKALELQAKDLQIEDRVSFLGHTEEAALYLRSLDIYVLTSRFEPYGVSLLEAKAAALPIVATCVNEIPSIILNNVSGLLIPSGSPEALSRVLTELARAPERREQLGRRALEEARTSACLETMVQGFQDLYEQALA